MALSDFTGPGYIEAWTADLDLRWPERAAMAECVVGTLVQWCDEWRVDEDSVGRNQQGRYGNHDHAVIRVLELGVGAAELARFVLDALADAQTGDSQTVAGSPDSVEYTGIDIEPALVLHGKELLETAGHRDIRLVRTDLRDDAWPAGVGPFDAAFSRQTFHDLGGIDALKTIYREIRGILTSGGILVNADFVVPFEKDDPEQPRRLPVETHKDLLYSLGFIDFRCEMKRGKMACMSARRG